MWFLLAMTTFLTGSSCLQVGGEEKAKQQSLLIAPTWDCPAQKATPCPGRSAACQGDCRAWAESSLPLSSGSGGMWHYPQQGLRVSWAAGVAGWQLGAAEAEWRLSAGCCRITSPSAGSLPGCRLVKPGLLTGHHSLSISPLEKIPAGLPCSLQPWAPSPTPAQWFAGLCWKSRSLKPS